MTLSRSSGVPQRTCSEVAEAYNFVLGCRPSPNNAAAESDQTIGEYIQAISDPSDPGNAFFAVLRRAVKAATGRFLESYITVETLDEQPNTF